MLWKILLFVAMLGAIVGMVSSEETKNLVIQKTEKESMEEGAAIYADRVKREMRSFEKWVTFLESVKKAQQASLAREIPVLPLNRRLPTNGIPGNREEGIRTTNFIEAYRQVLAVVQTSCWLKYDNENLYVIFKCDEPNLDKITYCSIKHDGPVWAFDDVEVFIDSDNNKNTYYLFGTDGAGNHFEMSCSIKPYKQEIEWSIPWKVRTSKGKYCWYAEMSIPLKEIGLIPKKGASFGISLNRERYAGQPDLPSGWPNGKFHEPELFGTAIFK